MYTGSKFEDLSPCGDLETELNTTGEYFISVQSIVKFRSWPDTFSTSPPDVSLGQV